MFEKIKEKLVMEKGLFIVMIAALLVVFGFIFYIFFGYASKKVAIVYPNEGDELELGKEYEIKWSARGVDKVGIALFDGENPEWIAQNIPANQGSYKWNINTDHAYGSDFWIAVFDYPWRRGSKIEYSKGPFKITYPDLMNCDRLSIEEEWPYLASNAPNLRKVFITPETFNGNLGGLEGADQKCQASAEKLGYEGNWIAFLGGDKDEETAVKRLEGTERGVEGFFTDAVPSSKMLNESTCHRLLGSNLEEFLKKLSSSKLLNSEKLEKDFLDDLSRVWLGRVDLSSKKTCLAVDSASQYLPPREKYSFTVTCQNWTQGNKIVPGYSDGVALDSSFSSCYTPKGEFTYSLALAGLATGMNGETYSASLGKYCSDQQHLLCIQD